MESCGIRRAIFFNKTSEWNQRQDPNESMSRFLLLACLATSPGATAFVSSPGARQRGAPALRAAEGTDFDAPVPFEPQSGTAVLEREPVVDDECYMGKDETADECVDFDPPKRTRSANAQDQPRDAPKWTQSTQNIFANIIK